MPETQPAAIRCPHCDGELTISSTLALATGAPAPYPAMNQANTALPTAVGFNALRPLPPDLMVASLRIARWIEYGVTSQFLPDGDYLLGDLSKGVQIQFTDFHYTQTWCTTYLRKILTIVLLLTPGPRTQFGRTMRLTRATLRPLEDSMFTMLARLKIPVPPYVPYSYPYNLAQTSGLNARYEINTISRRPLRAGSLAVDDRYWTNTYRFYSASIHAASIPEYPQKLLTPATPQPSPSSNTSSS